MPGRYHLKEDPKYALIRERDMFPFFASAVGKLSDKLTVQVQSHSRRGPGTSIFQPLITEFLVCIIFFLFMHVQAYYTWEPSRKKYSRES